MIFEILYPDPWGNDPYLIFLKTLTRCQLVFFSLLGVIHSGKLSRALIQS